MAADVYTEPPHVGRGGWTWYTGSAGWMYQAGVEWILGFRLRGTTLLLDPCIPRAWPHYEIDFSYHSATYEIVVENPQGVSRGVASSELDGQALMGGGAAIPLIDDGGTHRGPGSPRLGLAWAVGRHTLRYWPHRLGQTPRIGSASGPFQAAGRGAFATCLHLTVEITEADQR